MSVNLENQTAYLKHYEAVPGYTEIISDDTLKHLTFGVLRLAAGETLTFGPYPGQETTLTVLTGTLNADQHWINLGGRGNVFDGPTDTLLLPSESSVTLQAVDACEIAVCQAASTKTGPVRLYAGFEATIAQRGLSGWQREVRTYIDSGGDAQRLILGETINAVGQWSSFPPHKHDRDNLPIEADLEEVYLFKIDPPTGFAFQGLYDPNDPATANRAYVVRNNDVVAIPRGYHPVAAAPGHRVYYFWALAGIGNELKFFTDESMRWLQPGL
jgi:5-deoxy-glucuronate isomerase